MGVSGVMMGTIVSYAKERYFQKSHGWGRTWVRWLWLDAILFAIARFYTLVSPRFCRWCREVDLLFVKQHACSFAVTANTGRDCWIDLYWDGLSPQEAVDSEVSYWDDE